MHYATMGADTWTLSTECPFPRSPTNTWHGQSSDAIQDAHLVTPALNIPPGCVLSFWHTYKFESTFDGGVIEISLDGGITWTDLGEHIISQNGYNAVISTDYMSPIAGRTAWSGGTLGPMVEVRVDLSPFAGLLRLVRFRLASDAGNYREGWFIDDLKVEYGEHCLSGNGRLAWDADGYSCQSEARLTLSDLDLAGAGVWTVSVFSTTEPSGEEIQMTETDDLGVFAAAVPLVGSSTPTEQDGLIQVSDFDTLTAFYLDARSLDGTANVPRTATASLDCTPPTISDLSSYAVDESAVQISWKTDEPATSIVHYGLTEEAFDLQRVSPYLRSNHSILISGLTECTDLYFRVASSDSVGNTTVDDNAGANYSISTWEKANVFEDMLV
ncbi:MAG TPA: hypothetical protein PKH07_19445, partial [bacterium]|nr:hypothetical protein [bacterium]